LDFFSACLMHPFLVFMFYLFSFSFSLHIPLTNFSFFSIPNLFSIVIFLAFAVKLPIYGLHYWLPIAHVEAPTFGSIILAGVLLKLGGLGLIRLSNFISLDFIASTIRSYLLLFLFITTLVCCFQSDFKRLIAYSSVSHMIAVPFMFIAIRSFSLKSITLIIFFHGLSSPILFMSVGILYSLFSSRQLMLMRGLLLLSPSLSFMLVLSFFFTMSAPPFPSFVSEVFFLVSSFIVSPYFLYSFILFTFFSLVYNLNWLSRILFSSLSNLTSLTVNFSFIFFMVFYITFLLCFITVPILSFIYDK